MVAPSALSPSDLGSVIPRWPFAVGLSGLAIQAWGLTGFILQVAVSGAMMVGFPAQAS